MKRYINFILQIFIVSTLMACGNSGEKTHVIPLEENNASIILEETKFLKNVSGVIQKGLFIDGEMIIRYISEKGQLSDINTTSIIDSNGTYSLHIEKNALISLEAKGHFFNEYTGKNSINEVVLYALIDFKKSDIVQEVNLNLFTSLEHRRVLTLMKEGKNYLDALDSTRNSMKKEFGLEKNIKVTELNIYDLNGTLKDENLNLLLLSGAFLKSIDENSTISKNAKITQYEKEFSADDFEEFLNRFRDDGVMDGSEWQRMRRYDMIELLNRMASFLGLEVTPPEDTLIWTDDTPLVVVTPIVEDPPLGNLPDVIIPIADTSSFITRWKTNNEGASNDNEIIISTQGNGYNYDIDWTGNGTWDTIGATGTVRHTYANPGIYRVKIRGQFPRIFSDYQADRLKILSVEQWGNIEWTSMEQAFNQCRHLKINASDAPDLSRVTNMNSMFANTAINIENLNAWDVSNVTTMINLFSGTNFVGNIRDWNVSSVTDMTYMFQYTNFDQDISGWDVSSVASMFGMFASNSNFRQDIGAWDVHNVENMRQMFASATSFNHNLSSWNISKVTNMKNIFLGVTLSTDNYDAILQSWSAQDVQHNLSFNGGLSKYCASKVARESLISDKSWTITDAGESVSCESISPTPTIALDLQEASDSGIYHDDNITNATNLLFDVPCPKKDMLVKFYSAEFFMDGHNHTCQGEGLESVSLGSFESSGFIYRLRYTYQAEGQDESAFSPALRLNVDRFKPKDLTAADLQDASDTGSSQTDDITSQRRPIFDIKCDGIGSIITLWANSQSSMTECTSANSDRIVLDGTELEDGSYKIIYNILDMAGNRSDTSPDMYIKVDGTAPNVPTVTSPITGAVVSGTAEADATVVAHTATASCSTSVDGSGNYACTLTPAPINGESVEVVAIDDAGNISPKATGTITGITSNHAPVITSGNKFTSYEHDDILIVGANINATDPDGDLLTYSILPVSNGTSFDWERFTITTSGILYFKQSPDYEFPLSFDGADYMALSYYDVCVKVEDGRGGEAVSCVEIDIINRSTDVAFSPQNHADSIAIDSNLNMTFTNPVKTLSKGSGNIKIFKKDGDVEHTNFSVSDAQVEVSGNSITINPNADFEPETEYYVIIDGGVLEDENGVKFKTIGIENQFSLDKEAWTFTTGKAPEPNNPCACPDFADCMGS